MATRLTNLRTDVTAIETDIKIDDVDSSGVHHSVDSRLDIIESALNMATDTNEIDNRLMNLEKAITGSASDGSSGSFL